MAQLTCTPWGHGLESEQRGLGWIEIGVATCNCYYCFVVCKDFPSLVSHSGEIPFLMNLYYHLRSCPRLDRIFFVLKYPYTWTKLKDNQVKLYFSLLNNPLQNNFTSTKLLLLKFKFATNTPIKIRQPTILFFLKKKKKTLLSKSGNQLSSSY